MTVAMNDRDYAILLAAIGWIENHAGKDAPEYPEIEMLTYVVNNISQRREVESQRVVYECLGSVSSRISLN